MSNSSTSMSGNSHAASAKRPLMTEIPGHLRDGDGPDAPTSSEPISGAATASASSPSTPPASLDPSSSREALIATAAYYRAEKRGFAPGHETEDWLEAEREVDAFGADLAL